MINADFQALLQEILVSFKPQFIEGISEFDIITTLKQPPFTLFNEDALRDPLMLFQTHFVVFHSLYQLRNEWREQKQGELEIGATKIKLHPVLLFDANLITPDPLADYYLNWDNLKATDQAGVEALLDRFWQAMAGSVSNYHLTQDEINDAISILEIGSWADMSVNKLKQQYRKLQHSNHPDKGGSVERSQLILQAYTALNKHLLNT